MKRQASKPTPTQRRTANNTLDAWVLGLVARKARDTLPHDEGAAYSAFLSEVAGSAYLSRMPLARGLLSRTRGTP